MGVDYVWGHRPALTGVRALAVLLVIAFHAQLGAVGAGFVGVDLFFVLSGFLVCQVLLGPTETDAGPSLRPRLRDFYSRRTRRLLPASLVAAVGGALMTAGIVDQSVRATMVDSARASVLYVNNWHRIATADDFSLDNLFNVFNHWWSLSIEEQYYAVFPVVVGAVALVSRRRASWWLLAVLVTGCASSAAAQIALADDPVRAYYGTDTRAYQLLAGATLAVLVRLVPSVSPAGRRGTLARQIVGIGAVAVLVATATRSWGAVSVSTEGFIAAAASVSLIWSLDEARPRWLTAAFALGPVRFVGEISYGMYLWHWPVQVVLRASVTLSPGEVFVVSALLAGALAALSLGILETPIRRSPRLDAVPVATVVAGLAASVAVATWVVAPILRWESSDRLRYRAPVTTTVPESSPTEPGGPVLLEGGDGVDVGQGDANVIEPLEEAVLGG